LKSIRVVAVIVLAWLLAVGRAEGQPAQPDQGDSIGLFLLQLEGALRAGDPTRFLELVAQASLNARAAEFSRFEIQPGATRAVIQERDRQALAGPAGSRYRLMLDTFTEFGNRGRIAAWRLDIERIADDWRIVDQERLTSLEHLYRLSLDGAKQFEARHVTIGAEDLDLLLETGSVFVADTYAGATGLVFVGRGEMRFHPRPETEQGQVRIFSGSETLVTRFDALLLRINPADFERLIDADHLIPGAVDPRALRKALQVFEEDAPNSFHVGLGTLSTDSWSLLPTSGDLVAEVHTRRFGTLTYARSRSEAEDITLFDRKRHLNIALYPSLEKLERRGLSFSEDDLKDYDVLDYNIDVAVSPERQFIDGVARLLLQTRAQSLANITLRLAEPLVVRSVESDRFGRLFALRVKNQGSMIVSLPTQLPRDTLLTLTIVYSGRLEPQTPDGETVAVAQEPGLPESPSPVPEPNFLYSNRAAWYPQASFTDYATASLRISIPAVYDCVASGVLDPGWPQVIGEKDDPSARKVYSFSATQPLRYLALLISKFARTDTVTIALSDLKTRAGGWPRTGLFVDTLSLSVEANARQTRRGPALLERAADIAQFYTSLTGDCPYPSFVMALVEHDLPGGHSPAYFAELYQTLPNSALVWRNDPAAFEKYPDFFLAHELAHQWWGQAVGWRNYHEQWLSEGFAQYFAALYAGRQRGNPVFEAMLRHMRRWAIDQSDQGPVSLGYRLGHLRGDSRVFRALVYNKGAAVLHMLRRLIGDEAFFRGLQTFYGASRFRKVGTEDFKKAVEAETGRPLDRFFDRWIYGSRLPQVRLSYRVEGNEAQIRLEQLGDVFDVPVTVDLEYADRHRTAVQVALTDRTADLRVPLDGTLRSVQISKDDGSLVEIVK
jgi:hypothetical protein